MVKESVVKVIAEVDWIESVVTHKVIISGNYESGAPSPGERLAPQERNEMSETNERYVINPEADKRYDINEEWSVYNITWLIKEEECPCFWGGSCPTDGKHKVVGPLHYKHERNEND